MSKRTGHVRRQMVRQNTFRFFVASDAIQDRTVLIEDGDLVHQLSTVLRVQRGEQVLLLDNGGWQYVVTLTEVGRGRIVGRVEQKEEAGGEPQTRLTLFVALMRPERFEWVLQKGTEVGAAAFVPVICEHGAFADALSDRKLERWGRIVQEAAEQSRRGRVPVLEPAVSFSAAGARAARYDAALLLWEGGGVPSLRQVLRASPVFCVPGQGSHALSVALFSGPEGGFSSDEIEQAQRYGMIAVTLGPRTLRAETAPLLAATAVLYELGDLE